MNRRDRYDDNFDRGNNFDRMYDAREYRDDDYANYDSYEDSRENTSFRRRNDNYRRPIERPVEGRGDMYRDQEQPKKRSFFSRNTQRRRDRESNIPDSQGMQANQFVVMKPKNFDDIRGIIDNLKTHNALIVDLCRLNDGSVQRVMDYINGAIYALDGSIQRINPAVFLLTPTGMGISVPIDYIKDKWERNKKK